MQKIHKIEIITVKQSKSFDSSSYYLIDITFDIISDISCKRFHHTDYLDPSSNKIIKHIVKPDVNIVGNNRYKLLTELAVKLYLTDDDAKDLFWRVMDKLHHVIDSTPNLRKQFLQHIDIIRIALDYGFQLHQTAPEFHFIKTICTSRGDVELNICSSSIQQVREQLENFAESGTVDEMYTYHGLIQLCIWHSDFFIFINQLGNGWTICWQGDGALKMESLRVDTLRALNFAILNCLRRSKYR